MRSGVEAVVEFPAQLAQLVAHLGLGPAGNLTADSALAVCAPAEGDGTDVALLSLIEVDGVLAMSASSAHTSSVTRWLPVWLPEHTLAVDKELSQALTWTSG